MGYVFRDFQEQDANQIKDLFIITHYDAAKHLSQKKQDWVKVDVFTEVKKMTNMKNHYDKMFIIVEESNPDIVRAFCAASQVNDDQIELKNVVCDPERQGKGLGRMLMTAFDDYVRDQGYKQEILWTYEHLETAIKIYEKLGYKREDHELPDGMYVELNPMYMIRDM